MNSTNGKAAAAVLDLTDGRGVDVTIEAVGLPVTFDICLDIVTARPQYERTLCRGRGGGGSDIWHRSWLHRFGSMKKIR